MRRKGRRRRARALEKTRARDLLAPDVPGVELADLLKPELVSLATGYGLDVPARATKAEIIAAIEASEEEE